MIYSLVYLRRANVSIVVCIIGLVLYLIVYQVWVNKSQKLINSSKASAGDDPFREDTVRAVELEHQIGSQPDFQVGARIELRMATFAWEAGITVPVGSKVALVQPGTCANANFWTSGAYHLKIPWG